MGTDELSDRMAAPDIDRARAGLLLSMIEAAQEVPERCLDPKRIQV